MSLAGSPLPALADKGKVTDKALQLCCAGYTNVSPASCRKNHFDAKSKEEDLRPQNSPSEQIKWEGRGSKNYLLQAMQWLWGAVRTPSGPHALGHTISHSRASAVSSSSAAGMGWQGSTAPPPRAAMEREPGAHCCIRGIAEHTWHSAAAWRIPVTVWTLREYSLLCHSEVRGVTALIQLIPVFSSLHVFLYTWPLLTVESFTRMF